MCLDRCFRSMRHSRVLTGRRDGIEDCFAFWCYVGVILAYITSLFIGTFNDVPTVWYAVFLLCAGLLSHFAAECEYEKVCAQHRTLKATRNERMLAKRIDDDT